MLLLIALHDPSKVELTIQFAAQLVQARQTSPLLDESSTVLAVKDPKKSYTQSSTILPHAGELLGIPGVNTKLRSGSAGREILRETQEKNYDLIVIGESDSTVTTPLLSRESTATWVVEHVNRPVIVVKGKIGPIKRILLCDSGAENTLLSRMTTQLADLLEGEEQVTVLHVMSQISAWPGVRGAQLRADAEELIQEQAPEGKLLETDIQILNLPGIQARAVVRHGLVVDEILAEAQSGDYDLVVIGAHRGAGWQRLLLDDLAHKILVQMDRPVLVVR